MQKILHIIKIALEALKKKIRSAENLTSDLEDKLESPLKYKIIG
jgi:hypothetical protein